MSTYDFLCDAKFPVEFADIFVEMLKIMPHNFPNIKDVLDHFRNLNDDERDMVFEEIADWIGFTLEQGVP